MSPDAEDTRGSAERGGRGLERLVDVLEHRRIRYWVDSGVLLGLRRDGALVPWEKDIDLAVHESDAPSLLESTSSFEDLGYRVNISRYRGAVYALSLLPTAASAEDLRAGIHVYYSCNGYLWSPQPQMYVPPPAPDVHPGRRTPVGAALRWAMERWVYSRAADAGRTSRAPDATSPVTSVARRAFQRIDHGVLAETWPVSEVFVPLTWVVPESLVLPLGTLAVGQREFTVPGRTDEYLAYRYGDWRTPVSDWCYWADDRSILRTPPSRARRLLQAGWQPRPVDTTR
jgi:hypothetical protein